MATPVQPAESAQAPWITAADYDAWLDPEHQDVDELRALLTAPADGRLAVRPVSTKVNSVRNNGPHLLDAVEPGP